MGFRIFRALGFGFWGVPGMVSLTDLVTEVPQTPPSLNRVKNKGAIVLGPVK